MTALVFNTAKGRIGEFYQGIKNGSPANAGFLVLLLQDNVEDSMLITYNTLAELLADPTNVEADFTNYVRIELVDADLGPIPSPDETNNWVDYDLPDQTWASAGGATNNTLTKIIVGYVPDLTSYSDNDVIPCTEDDFAATTNGSNLTAQINANGFYRAA